MKPKICPICSCEEVSRTWWSAILNKCNHCGLMFNAISSKCDYENVTRFLDDDHLISRYKKYAKRDFDLIKSELGNVNRILEIGGGYGLLSVIIKENFPKIKYFHLEKNTSLRRIYLSRGDCALDQIDCTVKPDLIIMAHCLEHIEDAPGFIDNLLQTYKDSDIILFQTNPYGFIPKYLPWLWYGWSFDQHYYHFSFESLVTLMTRNNRSVKTTKYYQLHQEPSFTLKGFVKSFLAIVNFFVKRQKMDAYMVRFSR